MTGQGEDAVMQKVSSDPRQRMGDYQTMAVNARMKIHAVLAAAGLEPDAADELVCAVEAGAVAGAHCWVEELPGCAPGAHGTAYGDGWDGGVDRAIEVLVSTADSVYRQRGHARVTRSLLAGGEILHNRLAAADQAVVHDVALATAQEEDEVPAELAEQVIEICGRHYAAVTGTSMEQWDTELFQESVGIALRAVRPAERGGYPQALEDYLRSHRARLERLWGIYGPDGLFPGVHHLVELPEAFVLCERIDRSPFELSQLWSDAVGEDTPLERLQEAWLFGTGETADRYLR